MEHPEIEFQTRRVIKPQPPEGYEYSIKIGAWTKLIPDTRISTVRTYKPRYQVGETLYIKESWQPVTHFIGKDIALILFRDGNEERVICTKEQWDKAYYYSKIGAYAWHSPMMMPSWAARTFVTVLDVKAEKLSLPLPPETLEAEGGERALGILNKIDVLWVFAYTLKVRRGK